MTGLMATALCSDRSRHCEERSDAAIQGPPGLPLPPLDCRAEAGSQ